MSNSDNSGEEICATPIPEWSRNVMTNLLSRYEATILRKENPSIFRVPESIRRWDASASAYTPELVAIGPYHRESLPDTDICKSLEQYKACCVYSLLSGNSDAETEQLINSCLTELMTLAPRIRGCYSADDIGLPDDRDLAELMLLDGCFVLIRLLQELPEEERPICEGNGQGPVLAFPYLWSAVKDDLLKIENQIPLFVLTTLLGNTPRYGTGHVDVIKLARDYFKYCTLSESKSFEPAQQDDQGEYPYDHLLHFFYSSRLPKHTTTEEAGDSSSTEEGRNRSYCSVAVDLISRCLKTPRTVNPSADEEDIKTKYLKIPSATELHLAGVGFKEKENANSFLDIEFKKRMFRKGELEIPRLVIWDETDQLLRNLVAFEQCSERIQVKYMSDYVSFMDYLIDNSNDVDLLESKGVLENHTDMESKGVLTKGVGTDDEHNYLRGLYADVNEYHQSSWHQYRAKMKQDYFSNPWSIISLVGAILLLLMAAFQTVYTITSYYYKK